MIFRVKYMIFLTFRKENMVNFEFFEDPVSAEIKGIQPNK
jgi:hypothetical protein